MTSRSWNCFGFALVSTELISTMSLINASSKANWWGMQLKPQHTSYAGWVGTVKMGLPMLKLQRFLSSGTCCSFRPHPFYYCCWSSTEDTDLSSQYSDLLLHLIPEPDPVSSWLCRGHVRYSWSEPGSWLHLNKGILNCITASALCIAVKCPIRCGLSSHLVLHSGKD